MCDVASFELKKQQLLDELADLLQTSGDEASDVSALRLNQELQRHLELIRSRLVALLTAVRARYERNEKILIRRLQPRKTRTNAAQENLSQCGAVLRGGTFLFKGNLYFRDVDGRSCPNNGDYERRCTDEMFPTDFDMRAKHIWTMLDKHNIVMGVKQQLVDHAVYAPQTRSKCKKSMDAHVQSMTSLLADTDSSFQIDWNQISTLDVEYRHSAYSCEAMWQVYLQPQLLRGAWSPVEDERLLTAVKRHNHQNWGAIGTDVGRRSDYQCFVRFQTAVRFHIDEPLKWSYKDDERLKTLALSHTHNGITNWQRVVEHFPGKAKSSIIGRYTYVLHPRISHEPFTAKEDMMLFAAFEEYKGKFNIIPRSIFPNRSLSQLRTRYHNVLEQRNKTDSWSLEDDTKLMAFVTEHGSSQWLNCANYLGNHTRTSCRTRFLVIRRYLDQHPSAQVSDFPRRRSYKNSHITQDNWEQRLEEWKLDPTALDGSPMPKRAKLELTRKANKATGQRLRGLALQTYEYFKYAYNLRLLERLSPLPQPRDDYNFKAVSRALSSSSELELLPPNWCTLMGFRAICILSVDSCDTASSELEYDGSAAAVQLFRKRLRSLFFRTTLMSRLEPLTFEQLPAAMQALPRPL